MSEAKRRKLTHERYVPKFKVGDIVLHEDTEFIVIKNDRKNNTCCTLKRRFRPWQSFYNRIINKDELQLASQNWRENLKYRDCVQYDCEGINMHCVITSRDSNELTIQPIGVRYFYKVDIHSDEIASTLFKCPDNYKIFTEDLFSQYLNSSVQVQHETGSTWATVIDTFNDLFFVSFYTGGDGWYKPEQIKIEHVSQDLCENGFEEMGSFNIKYNKCHLSLLQRYSDQGILNKLMTSETFREAYWGENMWLTRSLSSLDQWYDHWVHYNDYTYNKSNHAILRGYIDIQRLGQDPEKKCDFFKDISSGKLRKVKRLEAILRAKKLIKLNYTLNGDYIKCTVSRPVTYQHRWSGCSTKLFTHLVPALMVMSGAGGTHVDGSGGIQYHNEKLDDIVKSHGCDNLQSKIVVTKCPTKIPLLPFQEQIVEMMIKREATTWQELFKCTTLKGCDFNIISCITNEGTWSGGILGLKVGLGKTICTLGLITKSPGKTLVVLTLSLIDQWIKETKKFTSLKIGEVHGRKDDLKRMYEESGVEFDIMFTTYGTLVSHFRRGGALRSYQFDRVIFDESHTIKSNGTTLTACKMVKANKRWCISATPFRDQIFKNINLQLRMLRMSGSHDNRLMNALTYDPHCKPNCVIVDRIMKSIIRPNIVGVITRSVTWHTHPYFIDIDTYTLYKSLFKMILLKVNELIQSYQFTRSYQKVKSLFNTLLIFCSSPSMVPLYWWGEVIEGITNSVNINELNEKLTAEESNFSKQVMQDLEKLNELTCCLCLEPFTRPTITKCKHMFCHECIHTSLKYKNKCPQCRQCIREEDLQEIVDKPEEDDVDNALIVKDPLGRKVKLEPGIKEIYSKIGESPKTEMIREIVWKSKQTVIFSEFNSVLEYFHKKVGGCIVSGRSTRSRRDKEISKFTRGESKALFLSLKIADVGINLTAADTIIFLEPKMDKSVEKQAIGRVRRIGQQNDIKIHRIVSDDVIEGKIETIFMDYNVTIRHIMNAGYSSATQAKKKKSAYMRCMLQLFKL